MSTDVSRTAVRANSWNSVNLTLDPGAVRHLDLSSWFLVTRPNFGDLQSCPLPAAWRKDWVCFSLSLLEPHPLAWVDSVVIPFLMTCSWKEREEYREAEMAETLEWISQEGVGWGEKKGRLKWRTQHLGRGSTPSAQILTPVKSSRQKELACNSHPGSARAIYTYAAAQFQTPLPFQFLGFPPWGTLHPDTRLNNGLQRFSFQPN